MSTAHSVALRMCLIYAGIGILWIIGSDRVLEWSGTVQDPNALQTWKGWAFVFATAALLYVGLRTQLQRERAVSDARRQAETELSSERERLRLAVNAGNIGLWDYDLVTGAMYFSPEWKRQLGFAEDELPNTVETWRTLVHPEDRDRVYEATQRYIQGAGGRLNFEYRLRHNDGSYRWILSQGTAELNAEGKPVRLVGSHVDVTAGKEAQVVLQEKAEINARLAHIAAVVPGAIISYHQRSDGTACFPYASPAIEDIYGCSPRDIASDGNRVFSRIHAEDLASVVASIEQSASTMQPWRCEFRFRHDTKGEVWIEGYSLPERQPDGSLLWNGFVMDITARKRTELSLRENDERFRQLAENIREVFWLTDPASRRILYVSPVYETISGFPVASLYANPRQWYDMIHPDDRPRVFDAMIESGKAGAYEEEFRISRRDGAIRWIRGRAFPVRDASGSVYRIAGIAEDITERKQLEEQFFRAQRLEAIGTLASGIAHDLNNVLAPIMMCAPMLRMGLPTVEFERMVGTIEASTRRGADLVRQLLVFGRGVDGGRGMVSPKELVSEMVKIASETFPKAIAVNSQVHADAWNVLGDATQLHQVLLNLCVNARDAMHDGGTLNVSVENVLIDTASTPDRNTRPGPYLRMRVADTGTGIAPEHLDKIFDPFFTTKPPGKGTGLGLSTVLGIVKSHGGFVRIDSKVGRGTAFDVYLPAQDGCAAESRVGDGQTTPKAHGELILLVEDEASIRDVVSDLLARQNYRVVTAEDGVEGETLFRENVDDVAMIITDLDMPRMDGVRFIEAARRIKADVPIVVSTGIRSGRPQQDRTPELEELGVDGVLLKPYEAEELIAAVYNVLRARAG